jgi:Zn-dependent peptidase ImmA (M78 family)/DNA-binding XRE family transcriptional regulator
MAIQPEILTWARETAGLSMEDAARAVGLTGKTALQRLAKLESGEKEPARPLVEKMAKAYRRPLVAFYLSHPPQTGDRGQDFRTLPGEKRDNPDLDALIRDIKARQELVHSILEDEESPPIDFIASVTMEVAAATLAPRIAERLSFRLDEFRKGKTADDAFDYVRKTIEGSGVFVLLIGNLGSYHTNIPVEIFRGFAIADKLAPMIVINDQDARAAWSFTAMHEVVHLWLGTTGVSGEDTTAGIEQYCNDVAGEVLLPSAELKVFSGALSRDRAVEMIDAYAPQWRVSRQMVAYKLYRHGKIAHLTWMEIRQVFHERFLAFKAQQSAKQKESEGGANYYTVKRHRVGSALLSLVRRALDDGSTTYTRARPACRIRPAEAGAAVLARSSTP